MAAMLADFQEKYRDKIRECESYIKISEHRLEWYNNLLQVKEQQDLLIEEYKTDVIEKEKEVIAVKETMTRIQEEFNASGRHTDRENQDLKDVRLIYCYGRCSN
jgi:hypothetical protein